MIIQHFLKGICGIQRVEATARLRENGSAALAPAFVAEGMVDAAEGLGESGPTASA